MTQKLLIFFCLIFFFACGAGKDDTGMPGVPEVPIQPEQPYVDKKIYVSSPSELNALKGLKATDTVVLRNGTYTNAVITIQANGTPTNPIVIMGESAGKVVLSGASSIKIGGSYIVVRNLWFKDILFSSGAVIDLRADSRNLASNCRVTNCAITRTNNSETLTSDYKWVSLYGERNIIDHCRFTDKTNMGTLLVVWLGEAGNGRHTIANNYFSRPNAIFQEGSEVNGQETIRVGDSKSSMQQAECIVENNHFYSCNGEMEVISNKSCGNIYRNNLLEQCVGALTLRHGNGCTVENNFFIGNNVANTGGVRIIGENHTVRGNYFENIKGSGYRTAICLIRGLPNSPAEGYLQVKNAKVESNIILNCTYAIHVNYGGSNQTMPVISTTISDNIISNPSSSGTAVLFITPPEPDVKWSGNTIYKGSIKGIASSVVAASTTQPTIASQTTKYNAIKSNSGVTWQVD